MNISVAYKMRLHPKKAGLTLSLFTALLFSHWVQAAAVGDAAPGCALSALDGGRAIDLSSYKGKPVYLDFWASWCGPCSKSFPFLNEIHRRFGDQGLSVIGVNLDEEIGEAKSFLANHPAEFTVATDSERQCAESFDLKGMPTSYLIDGNGHIHHIHLGFHGGESDELLTMVEKLVNDNNKNKQ